MTGLFLQILQMSVTGSFVIGFVLIARLLLKKAPKKFSYLLWALVLFRLLCPLSIGSSFSFVPKAVAGVETKEQSAIAYIKTESETVWKELPSLAQMQLDRLNAVITPQQDTFEEVEQQEHRELMGMELACLIWLFGVILLAGYSFWKLVLLYRRVEVSLLKEGNVYLAQDIATPFTLGFISPKIYLPMGLSEKESVYIIAHEKHHIKRGDHIIKLVAFLTLCVHWFNPLVWFAFFLAGKDMEMSCDEAVMKDFAEDIRQEYSGSLLNLATGRKIISMAPLAFGEGSVKSRIKNVMNYKKPAFWISLLAAVGCILLALGLLTNPEQEEVVTENIMPSSSTEASAESLAPTAEPVIAPTQAPVAEADNFVEKEISVFYGDLTGDGVNERIVLSVDVALEDADTDDVKMLLQGGYLAKVTAYKGLGGDSFEEEFLWNSGDISTSRPGNYQISLLKKGERHYLLVSTLHEQMGDAHYQYQVISFGDSGKLQTEDSYDVTFRVAEAMELATMEQDLVIRTDVVPDFAEHLEKWYDEEGILIIATDVNLWEEDMDWVLYSTEDNPVWYMKYYESVFNRQDYYTLKDKTIFTTKYFTLNLPEEWAGKVHIEESEDGKSVWVYHTKTQEMDSYAGLLGSIFLIEQEYAAEMLEMAPMFYIGRSCVVDGITYVPMSCAPTDVQSVPEYSAEYDKMSSYFSGGLMARYACITEHGFGTDALWELAYYKELNPEYGLRGRRNAVVGQELLWENSAQETVLFDTDGESHTLRIGDKDYSDMLNGVMYISDEAAARTWYAVVDLDKGDRSREIMVYDDGPSGDPGLHIIRITDGKLKYLGQLGILASMSSFELHGDGTVTILERTWVPENNVTEKTYRVTDGGFEEIPREEYAYLYRDYHELLQDLMVYVQRDLSSETVLLKAGEVQLCFNKVFFAEEGVQRFYEIETDGGEIYYLYSDGWLDDYVADLSHAG